jgi:hypothetical protein
MINLQVLPRIVIEEISVWRMRARGGEEQLQRPRQAKNDGPSGLKQDALQQRSAPSLGSWLREASDGSVIEFSSSGLQLSKVGSSQ